MSETTSTNTEFELELLRQRIIRTEEMIDECNKYTDRYGMQSLENQLCELEDEYIKIQKRMEHERSGRTT